jgi:putative acetyltransferase
MAELVPLAAHHRAAAAGLITEVYREYGMTFDRAFEADLADISGHYQARGGRFWVLLDGTRVVGTVGAVPRDAGTCEIKRVYLDRAYRGRGHGRTMIAAALGWAAGAGFETAVAWSDVRLTTAHAVYRHLGFEPRGERTLDDPDRSREQGFWRALDAPGPP